MNKKKILILEENEKKRKQLTSPLSGLALDIEESSSFYEAHHRLLNPNNFSLVLVSLLPFDKHHIKNLNAIRKANSRVAIVLHSKIQNQELAISLLERGIVDYITSPDNPAGIFSAIKNEFNKRELIEKNESYQRSLHKLKSEQKKYIKKALDLEEIYDAALENLITALDLRDVETFGHSKTVAKYSLILAGILGIKDKNKLNNIRKGALLHDVGKIAIPDSILKKPNPLSPQEWEKIKLHPTLGYGLIREINLLKEIGNIILYHHERYDGSGYPSRLKKKDIPIEARIFALVDALDAITSHRPYRKERKFEVAKKEIQDNSGTQFDPSVVEAFCSMSIERWKKIRFETTKLIPSIEQIQEVLKR